VIVTTPLSVVVCHLQAGLAMTNLCTKFEVYLHPLWIERPKATQKAQNGAVWGIHRSLKVTETPFDRAHTSSY